jgi:hypothetical protein
MPRKLQGDDNRHRKRKRELMWHFTVNVDWLPCVWWAPHHHLHADECRKILWICGLAHMFGHPHLNTQCCTIHPPVHLAIRTKQGSYSDFTSTDKPRYCSTLFYRPWNSVNRNSLLCSISSDCHHPFIATICSESWQYLVFFSFLFPCIHEIQGYNGIS